MNHKLLSIMNKHGKPLAEHGLRTSCLVYAVNRKDINEIKEALQEVEHELKITPKSTIEEWSGFRDNDPQFIVKAPYYQRQVENNDAIVTIVNSELYISYSLIVPKKRMSHLGFEKCPIFSRTFLI